MSRAAIFSMEVEGPEVAQQQQPQGVRMDDLPGKPGTPVGLALRVAQFVCAVIAVAVMASSDFSDISGFSFLVAASGLLCVWSSLLIILDAYAMLVKRRLRHHRLDRLFTLGDAITGALLLTAANAAGASSGTFSIEVNLCETHSCASYASSVVFAYFSVLALFFTFFLNLSSWASAGPEAAGPGAAGAAAAAGAA